MDQDVINFAKQEFDQFNPSILRRKQHQLLLEELDLLFPGSVINPKYFKKSIVHSNSEYKIDVLSELSDSDGDTFGVTFIAQLQNLEKNHSKPSIAVLKFFKQQEKLDRIAHMIHELLIGLAVVNRLAKKLPTFIKTRGYVSSSKIFPVPELEEETSLRLQELSDPLCPILILEPVLPSLSMHDWLMSAQFQLHTQCHFYAHIICSLMVAFEDSHFIHQDLLLSNILLQPFNHHLAMCDYVDTSEEICLVYPSQLAGVEYRVLVHKYIPRLIDYGISSARINGQYYSYLSVIHETPETYHFMSDISKLIGFPIWFRRAELNIAMALATHQKAIEWANEMDGPFSNYIDSWLESWLYRLVYTNGAIDLARRTKHVEYRYLPWNIHPIWEQLCHAKAVFETCVLLSKSWKDDFLPYFPRSMNPLELVNYYYLPNFEIYIHLEEIYIKLRTDRLLVRSIPLLDYWVRFLEQTDIFNGLRRLFQVQSNQSYFKVIEGFMLSLHRMWPHVQVYLEKVLLDPEFKVLGKSGCFLRQVKKTKNVAPHVLDDSRT